MTAHEDPSVAKAVLAHTLVAGHADRVQELARLYGLLERVATASGPISNAARDAHERLGARILEWEAAALDAERRDVIQLTPGELEALREETARAIVHAERHATGLPATSSELATVRSLQRIHAAFPTTLTRAALVRFRNSAARRRRLEALGGPSFLLGTEADALLGALESATAPVAPSDIEFDPENCFRGTFAWGLTACVIRQPGASGGLNLGLGTSPAVAALLGGSNDPRDLYERWLKSAAPSHAFARYPYVPHGRFCTVSGARVVGDDLRSTGPIGWGVGDAVASVARDLLSIASEQVVFASELSDVSNRVESAARRGDAIIGFIEYVPAEPEERRQWFINGVTDA